MSEDFASYEETVKVLKSLGFVAVFADLVEENKPVFFDSPKKDECGLPVAQVYVYLSRAGYYCVSVYEGFQAPCTWLGPRASWDKTDTQAEFVLWLDNNHPGWR